ncbi:hypothetical protein GA0061074_10749 [Weissella bombi]|uniref:Type IV leader peptidase family protein n=1 Tax=Weissella bombi TaxID=1505725 RepID=A0A1C4AW13_9LACO|nr:hypothetical protein GA0061074_10749 [Weissella bombi]
MFFESLLLIILIYLSYQDICHHEFNSVWLSLPLFIGGIFYRTPIFTICAVYILCLIINTLTNEHYIGNGDLDILAILLFYVSFYEFWIICICACSVQLVCHIIITKDILPFVPAITFGYAVILCYYYLN